MRKKQEARDRYLFNPTVLGDRATVNSTLHVELRRRYYLRARWRTIWSSDGVCVLTPSGVTVFIKL